MVKLTDEDSWNRWDKKSPSERILGDCQAHPTRIKVDLVVAYLRSEQRTIGRSTGNLTIGHEYPEIAFHCHADHVVKHLVHQPVRPPV